MTTRLIDLTGREFGGLRVLSRGPSHPSRLTLWTCRCAGCGRTVDVPSQNLREGRVRSCGGPECRGKFPRATHDDPETAIRSGSAGTTAALLRAAVDGDRRTMVRAFAGLDEDDDLTDIVLQMAMLCAVALRRSEGSTAGAHAVVDLIAAHDREVTK